MMKDDGFCQYCCCCCVGRWAWIYVLYGTFQALVCNLCCEWLNNVGVFAKCGKSISKGSDDRAALALFELDLDIRPQASHCLGSLNPSNEAPLSVGMHMREPMQPSRILLYMPAAADEAPICLRGLVNISWLSCNHRMLYRVYVDCSTSTYTSWCQNRR